MKKIKPKKQTAATGLVEVQVFTRGYRPFVMGGSCHYFLAARVKVQGPIPLGRGFQGYLVKAPNGHTFIAEASSGAFVGRSLESVRKDIVGGDPAVMRQQVAEAFRNAQAAELQDEDMFWRSLKCAKGQKGLLDES